MIAAIYARVSTQDQNQDLQLTELRQYVGRMGWTSCEYAEKASSVKKRPVLDQMMADARLRKFDVLVVWKIDRFGRSLAQLIANIQALDTCGVRFIALTQGIDTDRNNPAGRLMLHILAVVAEFERALIVERVRAGIAEHQRAFAAGRIGRERHTRSGKDLPTGRPKKVFRRDKALAMRKAGKSWRAIEAVLGVPQSTIRAALKNA